MLLSGTAMLEAQLLEDFERANWMRMRRIHRDHVPEFGLYTRRQNLAAERGLEPTLRFRYHVRTYLSLVGQAQNTQFESINFPNNSENLSSLNLYLINDKHPYKTLTLGLNTGHDGRPGAEVSMNNITAENLFTSWSLSHRPGKSSLVSLQAKEDLSTAEFSAYWDIPGIYYAQWLATLQRAMVREPLDAHGQGWTTTFVIGAELWRQEKYIMGEGFFSENFLTADSIRFRPYGLISQTFSRFDASQEFFSVIDRTRETNSLALGLGLDLPVSRRLGFKAYSSVGHDLARDLSFGKIQEYSMLVKIVPTVRYQFNLGFNHRTENVGNISGGSTTLSLGFHLNL